MLAPGAIVHDGTASGGAFARERLFIADLGLASGTYVMRARVKATTAGKAEFLANNELIGAWKLTTVWKEIDAIMWLNEGELVTVQAAAADGKTTIPKIDVDWISMETAAPRITTRGLGLLGPDGAPWYPRGVNFPALHVPEKWNGRLQLNRELPAEDLYRWGNSMVRVQMNQEHWLADCETAYGTPARVMNYRAVFDEVVTELTNRGVAVLLTLTVVERGQATGCTPAKMPILKEMADMRSVTFWKAVAARYADNPLVLFDLFNEPHDISDTVWRLGGTVYYKVRVNGVMKTKSYKAAGMQALVDAVRSTGARNALSVSGIFWAGKADILVNKPLDAAGVFAGIHIYCHECAANDPHFSSGFPNGNDKARTRFPVVVTEAGWEQSNDPRFNRLVINWAEANADGWSIYSMIGPDGACTVLKEWDDQTYHIGNGVFTLEPSRRGASTWNALAPLRLSRGFEAALMDE